MFHFGEIKPKRNTKHPNFAQRHLNPLAFREMPIRYPVNLGGSNPLSGKGMAPLMFDRSQLGIPPKK